MLRRESTCRGFAPLGPNVSRNGPSRRRVSAWVGMEAAISATLFASEFEIGPWHDDDDHREQHHGRGGETLTEILSEEHVIVDIFCRHLRGDTRAAAGLGYDQVVDLDDAG